MFDPGNSHSTLKSLESDSFLEDKDDERSCKICYGADNQGGGEWVTPCKCSGTIKWVHRNCLLRWIESAPYLQQHMCSMCRYQYRRCWHIKPFSRWSLPKLNLNMWDVIEILLDMYSTVKLVRNTAAAIQGTKSVFGQMFYFVFWRTFIFTNHRIQYYKGLCITLFTSIFEPSIQNAFF